MDVEILQVFTWGCDPKEQTTREHKDFWDTLGTTRGTHPLSVIVCPMKTQVMLRRVVKRRCARDVVDREIDDHKVSNDVLIMTMKTMIRSTQGH